jgi:hypothetical protein
LPDICFCDIYNYGTILAVISETREFYILTALPMKTLFSILTGIDLIFLNLRLIIKNIFRWLRQKGLIPRRTYFAE